MEQDFSFVLEEMFERQKKQHDSICMLWNCVKALQFNVEKLRNK